MDKVQEETKPIRKAISFLKDQIGALHKEIEDLTNAIKPITGPEQVSELVEEPKNDYACMLEDAISVLGFAVMAANKKLSALRNRLCL